MNLCHFSEEASCGYKKLISSTSLHTKFFKLKTLFLSQKYSVWSLKMFYKFEEIPNIWGTATAGLVSHFILEEKIPQPRVQWGKLFP